MFAWRDYRHPWDGYKLGNISLQAPWKPPSSKMAVKRIGIFSAIFYLF